MFLDQNGTYSKKKINKHVIRVIINDDVDMSNVENESEREEKSWDSGMEDDNNE